MLDEYFDNAAAYREHESGYMDAANQIPIQNRQSPLYVAGYLDRRMQDKIGDDAARAVRVRAHLFNRRSTDHQN